MWGGDPDHAHTWDLESFSQGPAQQQGATSQRKGRSNVDEQIARGQPLGCFCVCGAWQGSLGLEPTLDLYVEHLVECFSHVWRVLRDDGVLFVNLGDSYAGSGRGPTGHNGIGDQTERQGFEDASKNGLSKQLFGLKPKDLMLIPFRVAMALQASGWYLRSVIPWLKRSAMPESVTDRPTTSVEYVFLLAKSGRYYWDADAVRVEGANPELLRSGKGAVIGGKNGALVRSSAQGSTNGYLTTRNRRNSDWFFESWQGLLLNEQDEPLALVVNPTGFSEAHFATFPAKLIEPMIKASTRAGDTVLDPFGGAGTTGLVADRLGRNAILCELSDSYTSMGHSRIRNDAPLLAGIELLDFTAEEPASDGDEVDDEGLVQIALFG